MALRIVFQGIVILLGAGLFACAGLKVPPAGGESRGALGPERAPSGDWTKPPLGEGRLELADGSVAYRYCDPRARLTAPRLRLANYNIYLGGRWRMEKDQVSYPNSLGKVVSNLGALGEFDVLGLQEVDVGGIRVQGIDPADVIAHHFGLCGVFTVAHDFRSLGGYAGRFGNAILSRYPFADTAAIHFEATNRSGLFETAEFERRGMAYIRIKRVAADGSRGDVHLLSTHLSQGWSKRIEFEDRQQQIRQIREWVRPLRSAPVVVMGDFNSSAKSEESRLMTLYPSGDRERGYFPFRTANELTGQPFVGSYAGHDDPSKPPSSQLDQFYVAGFKRALGFHAWRPTKRGEQGSDHLPVIVTLEF